MGVVRKAVVPWGLQYMLNDLIWGKRYYSGDGND